MITPSKRQPPRLAGHRHSRTRRALPAQFRVAETPLSPEQLAKWQREWDALMTADAPHRQKLIWLPRGSKVTPHPPQDLRRIKRMRRHLAAKHNTFQEADRELMMARYLTAGIITRQEFDEGCPQ
jgi:hypothetical protein